MKKEKKIESPFCCNSSPPFHSIPSPPPILGDSTMQCVPAKSLQSCPTLCNPIDGSSPGSPVPGILQARTLEWVAISFSNAWKLKVKVKSLSRVRLLATPWTAAYQAPPPMGFSRQEYWSGVPSPFLVQCNVCLLSHFSCVRLFATLWTVPHQALLSMGFSRQEHWSGLPCPPPGTLPDLGIEPLSPAALALQADSSPLSHQCS